MTTTPRGYAPAVDTVVVAVLTGVACVGLAPVYAGSRWVVAAGGGLLLGLAAAWLGTWRRLPAVAVALTAVSAFLLFGAALALPDSPGLPTPGAVGVLLSGAINGWRDVLTLTPPLEARDTLLVPAMLAPMIASVVSLSLALRVRRWPWTALLAPAVLLGLIGVLGTARPFRPVVQGIVLLTLGLAWVAWRRRSAEPAPAGPTPRPAAARNRALAGATVVLLAATAGGLSAPALFTPERQRFSLREVVQPPLDPRDYPSPLIAFRKYVKDLKETTLFTVEGLPAGARIRLATLDSYDGVVWQVAEPGSGSGTGNYARVGERTGDPVQGARTRLRVTMGDYPGGVWTPTVGNTTAVRFEGNRAAELAATLHYNAVTGTALTTRPLIAGDSYLIDAVLPAQPTDLELTNAISAPVSLPEPQLVPPAVSEVAGKLAAEATTPVQRARALQAGLAQGFFSHGLEGEAPSRAGHGADRLAALLGAAQLIGDQEQYAPVMALMARQLGLPARVVMGFVPDGSGQVAVTGDDVSAWVEVAFADQGWVVFDPTPDKDRKPQAQAPKPRSEPRPQVQQPPPPVQTPEEPPVSSANDTEERKDSESGPAGFLTAVLKYAVLPLLLILGPCLLLIGLKLRRRQRRARTGSPSTRMAGGWAEIVDSARDLGTRPPVRATRQETAHALQQVYSGAGAVAMADRADAGVFAPGEPSEQDVQRFWAEVEASLRGMHASVGRWRRLRARLSLASLRRS